MIERNIIRKLFILLISPFTCLTICLGTMETYDKTNYSHQQNICKTPCIFKLNKTQVEFNKPLGDSVEMFCYVAGVHKQTELVVWERNGEPIFMNKVSFHNNNRYILKQIEDSQSRVSSVFIINKLQATDQGSYTCKISDSDEELQFTLSVFEPQPDIHYSPLRKVEIKAPGYTVENKSFNISCSIDTGSSQSKLVTIDWYQNGIYLSTSKALRRVLIKQIISLSNNHMKKSNEMDANYNTIRSVAILVFEYPTSEINGVYECRAYKPISQTQYLHIDSAILNIRVLTKHQYQEGNISQLNIFPSNNDFPSSKGNQLMKHGNHQLQNDDLAKKESLLPVTLSDVSNNNGRKRQGLDNQTFLIFAFIFHCYYSNCYFH